MVTMPAPTPRLSLDGKRIAANSFVIALHVAAIMVLLAPVSAPAPVAEPETITIPDWTVRPPPPPPPPPPIDPTVRTVTQAQPTSVPVPVPTPPQPSEVTYPDGTELAVPDTGPTTPTDYGNATGPAIQSLVTDRAPAPPYPAMALRRNITGTVVLLILVDASGNPTQVEIEQSSGSTLLDEAAQKFIRARWHFVPAQQDGVAVSAYARVPIHFTL
jgi:periplasmic protein TonB